MQRRNIYVTLVFLILMGIFSTQAFAGEAIKMEKIRAVPDGEWQCEAAFPDWKGYVDDTLALNSILSFDGWHGQGYFYVTLDEDTESLRLFVNGCEADVSFMRGGESCRVDFSAVAKDGKNTILVTEIMPGDLEKAVTVSIPYPVITDGSVEESGILVEVGQWLLQKFHTHQQ